MTNAEEVGTSDMSTALLKLLTLDFETRLITNVTLMN